MQFNELKIKQVHDTDTYYGIVVVVVAMLRSKYKKIEKLQKQLKCIIAVKLGDDACPILLFCQT